MVKLNPISSPEDIFRLEALARVIWTEHYLPIIGQEQIDYMLDKFQSASAITSQIREEGYLYYLIVSDEVEIGYLGLVPDKVNDKMMISKIYVGKDARGKGAGKAALDFSINLCKQQEISKLWLTVNRYNHVSINWYKKNGFEVTDEVVSDIGNGFVMDDYVMELAIGGQ